MHLHFDGEKFRTSWIILQAPWVERENPHLPIPLRTSHMYYAYEYISAMCRIPIVCLKCIFNKKRRYCLLNVWTPFEYFSKRKHLSDYEHCKYFRRVLRNTCFFSVYIFYYHIGRHKNYFYFFFCVTIQY